MSTYKKLSDVRAKFHELELKKTGLNKFAGFKYFELSDFLVPALKLFREAGLLTLVSFSEGVASLTIVDIDQKDSAIVFTSPMGHATLKGCHEVQNIGAVETYQRRYLYVTALEIVEHDALDASVEPERKKQPPVTKLVSESIDMEDEHKENLILVSIGIENAFEENQIDQMMELYTGLEDNEDKIFVWSKLGSKARSAIKKAGNSDKSN